MSLSVTAWTPSKIKKNSGWSGILGKNSAGLFGPIQAPSKSTSWNLGVGRCSLNGSKLDLPALLTVSS